MNLYGYLLAALALAVLQALALYRRWFPLEVIAKPGVMISLFAWLLLSVGLDDARLWFGAGILLSLVGDVLLMISLDRFFLGGLIVFLLAHIAYIVGFNIPIPGINFFGIVFAVFIGLGGARIIRLILDRLPASGQGHMRLPILVYSAVISVMLLSAMMKLVDVSWNANAAALAAAGAFFFYLSDIILAWNKFVSPIQHGRIYNIGAYHLGQIALITGVIMQFS